MGLGLGNQVAISNQVAIIGKITEVAHSTMDENLFLKGYMIY